MASVKTITLPDGSSYDFKATYDIEGNNISETYINKNEKGAASGVAPLDSNGIIDENYLPISGFVSRSGKIVSFNYNKADVPFSSLKVKINPVQFGSGNPSPTNIRNFIGFSSAKFTASGKNLARMTNTTSTATDTTFVSSATDGSVTISGTSAKQRFLNENYSNGNCSFPKNVKLRLSGGGLGTGVLVAICYTDADGVTQRLTVSNASNPVREFIIPEDYETVWLRVLTTEGNTYNNTVVYPSVTLVDDDDMYEVFDGSVKLISFSSAGTIYGGELDILSGVLTVTKKLYEFTSETTYTRSTSSGGVKFISQPGSNIKSADQDLISNMYSSVATSSATIVNECIRTTGNVIVYDNRFTSNSAVDSILAENPIQVLCTLEEPITYQLTTTEVSTLLGKNRVWCDAGDVDITIVPDGVVGLDSSGKIDEKYLPISEFVSSSGSMVTFNYDEANVPFSSLKVHITPTQSGSGDPSPANIRPITGYDTINTYASGEDTSSPTTYAITTGTAGTVYGGELDVLNGKLTVTHNLVDMGTLTWTRNSSYPFFQASLSNSVNGINGEIPDICCSIYSADLSGVNSDIASNNADKTITLRAGTSVFVVKDEDYTDASSFSSFMSGKQLVYELKTPQTYQLTQAEVTTLLGQNNVWSDAGDVELTVLPSGVRDYLNGLILVVTQNSSTGELTLS